MKLQEVDEKSNISINVKKDGLSASFPSEIVKVFSDCILVELFEHEGNVISFDGEDLEIELVVVKPGEVPYFFKNVRITRETYEDKPYHCIRTGTIGVRLNRRNAFRAFIGEDGSAVELPGNVRADVFVKDLSSTGIGLLVYGKPDKGYEEGQSLHITFSDSLIRANIDAMAKVVRIVESDNEILYGCAFSKHYPEIDKYVAAKQVRKGLNKKKEPV